METTELHENKKPKYVIEAAAITTCGPIREENQDAIVLSGKIAQRSETILSGSSSLEKPFSAAVIDGMGGYAGGADAACLVATALSKYDLSGKTSSEIDNYFYGLSKKVLQAGQAWQMPKMGAAFAMLTLKNDVVTVANVGDCRIYKYLPDEEILAQISEDDRLRNGHGITQSIGCVLSELDSHPFSESVQAGTRFLICSDGVWGTINEDDLQLIAEKNMSATDVVCTIAERCYKENATDNCSIVFIKIKDAFVGGRAI